MTADFVVDLDLRGNKVTNVAPGLATGEAVIWDQLGNYVDIPAAPPPSDGDTIVWVPDDGSGNPGWVAQPAATQVEAGDGIAISVGPSGGDLISVQTAASSGISVGPGGISVDLSAGIGKDPLDNGALIVNVGTGLAHGTGADDDNIVVDETWLAGQIASGSSNVAAGNGIDIAPGSPSIISVKPDGTAPNALTVTNAGVHVPKTIIVPSGMVTANEAPVGTWTIDVDSLQLANTYVGPGTDDATINADVATQGGVPEAGDLYINNTTGQMFVCSDGTTWIELAQAPSGIVSIVSPDDSITVAGNGPPTEAISINRQVTDGWYPALGGTTPNDGDTIIWDEDANGPGDGAWVPVAPGNVVGAVALAAGDVTTDGITASTFAHGLNTSDVTVSVKQGLCFVDAAVCEVDPNTISVETAIAGDYRVVVTGVQG